MSTNINDIYTSNSNFLKHADLKGQKVNVTIEEAEIGEVGDKKQVVLSFKESSGKKLGLNKTNAQMLAMLTGTEDYTNWKGIRITIKPSMTTYQGQPTPCIRIADELPSQSNGHKLPQPAQPQASDDDVPF